MRGRLQTPWGLADCVTAHGPGIVSVSTPSHGGFRVDRELRERIPSAWRDFAWRWSKGFGVRGEWFEEDFAAWAVVLTFSDRFEVELELLEEWRVRLNEAAGVRVGL